jgi:hypothetical protein
VIAELSPLHLLTRVRLPRWAAIAKGAVCVGLESIVNRRILPCHYGVEMSDLYDPAIHDAEYNFQPPSTGLTYNTDTIAWFAKMVSCRLDTPFFPNTFVVSI